MTSKLREELDRARSLLGWLERDGIPEHCPDFAQWVEEFERTRWTARDEVDSPALGPCIVSSAFMGFDLSHGLGPRRLFYGTAVFARKANGSIGRMLHGEFRTATQAEARACHRAVLEQVRRVRDAR